jgi:hypothetical protein
MKQVLFGAVVLAVGVAALPVAAQRGEQAAPEAPRTAQNTAPLDLMGQWVSVVTEDWRWRMMTPAKGDAPGIPLNAEGIKVTNAWDLARDNAGGQATQCKAYGAAGLLRIPLRVRFSWQDAMTLKLDTDAGRQTRLLRFYNGPVAPRATGEASLQGHSVATWQLRTTGAPLLGPPGPGRGGRGAIPKGSLKVVTTNLRPGYTRKNGVPYSEHTVLTEYFDRHEDFGAEWFTVTTVVDDPTYYASPFVTTTHFKKETDTSKWNPQPCETMPPTVDRVSRGEGVG